MEKFTPREYLKIDIANNFHGDLEKSNFEKRIEWFDQNESKLESLIKQSETPALYYAGVQAWRDVVAGKPSGYPISLDACSSGFQILSCITGDVSAAKLCGVIDTGKREDAYVGIFDIMASEISGKTKIARKKVKLAIMTALYGSTAIPEEVFGTGELLAIFHKIMERVAPYVWELNAAFLDIWDPEIKMHSWVMPDNFHVHVKVMCPVIDKVHFLNQPYDITRYVNQGKEGGKSLAANTTHSLDGLGVREMTRRCSYDPAQRDAALASLIYHGRDEAAEYEGGMPDSNTKMVLTLWHHYLASGFLSVRIMDHLTDLNARYVDRDVVMNLISTLPVKPFQLLSVHDCFRCLPSYGNDLRQQYIHFLTDLAKSKMLSYLLSQILQRQVPIVRPNPEMWKLVAQANYPLS